MLGAGCAQISSTSEVHLVPGEGEPRVYGAPGGWELDRSYEARWVQLGNQLVVELSEHRSCRQILHVPVVRVEEIDRKPDATLVWEFVVTGALAGFASFAFARPEAFGGQYQDESGEIVTSTEAGYRTGGIFMGIAAIMFASGVYDAVRSRDETIYTDAFELRPGDPVACAEPVRPVAERTVTLVVEEHEYAAITDREGRVRLWLPDQTVFADAKGKLARRKINAAVRVDSKRAIRGRLRGALRSGQRRVSRRAGPGRAPAYGRRGSRLARGAGPPPTRHAARRGQAA